VCERGRGARSAVGLREVPCDVTPLRREAIVVAREPPSGRRGCQQKLALYRILDSHSSVPDGSGAKTLAP
jgi:hypothetical protein